MAAIVNASCKAESEAPAVFPAAHRGCYLATCGLPPTHPSYSLPEWALGLEEYELEDGINPPDLSIDPEDFVLSAINNSANSRSYFISVENCRHVISATGQDMLLDEASGKRFPLITFIAIVPPHCCMDLATLVPQPPKIPSETTATQKKKKKSKKKKSNSTASDIALTEAALASIGIFSDVQEFNPDHIALAEMDGQSLEMDVFPLAQSADSPDTTPWLCTQTRGGSLTHFAHPSTYHAVDFRCPVGTPVVSVFCGTVVEVNSSSSSTGIHVNNLFDFNSIMIKKSTSDEDSEETLFAEYVHISREGVMVSVGDEVEKGQIICLSGEAGFCPEPHLHFQVQRSKEPNTPSVPLRFKGEPFVAGIFYP